MVPIVRVNQGKVIVERATDDPTGWLIMFPTGDIEYAPTKDAAERRIKAWLDADLRRRERASGANVGISIIEWR